MKNSSGLKLSHILLTLTMATQLLLPSPAPAAEEVTLQGVRCGGGGAGGTSFIDGDKDFGIKGKTLFTMLFSEARSSTVAGVFKNTSGNLSPFESLKVTFKGDFYSPQVLEGRFCFLDLTTKKLIVEQIYFEDMDEVERNPLDPEFFDGKILKTNYQFRHPAIASGKASLLEFAVFIDAFSRAPSMTIYIGKTVVNNNIVVQKLIMGQGGCSELDCPRVRSEIIKIRAGAKEVAAKEKATSKRQAFGR